ncbi:probable aspartic proteinase GIP2 [Ricinus communis]|uniref:probable aspartic proteinase GIP2 n=1 Tax=Ricinus communis TaxID=3988 RepID=UPI00201ADE1A|nr:probable aspartic proteinase GIP2 [Ricinus communis]
MPITISKIFIRSNLSQISPNQTVLMASSSIIQFLLFSFLVSLPLSIAQASSKPKALILPVNKDATTLQYVTHLNIGTPLAKKDFVVDLGGAHLWMDCDDGSYVSSTFRQSLCGSAPCSVAKATCTGGCVPGHHKSGCSNETCYVLSTNTIQGRLEVGVVSRDIIALQSTDGAKSGSLVSIPDYIFACANAWDLKSLASGAKGMLGLGREQIALPKQLSSSFGGSFRRKFAICLPSDSKSNGVMFFGDSPYVFYPSYNTSKAIDVSSRFKHTKLYINTVFTGSSTVIRGPPSPEYFVRVTSILVNRKPIPINRAFLEFHANGTGGTKISTVEPYIQLESTIYKAVVEAFDEEISVWNVSKVAPVAPFKDCYSLGNMGITGLGISVPDIAFEFENNKNLNWGMYGANTMVEVSRDVVCLAFLDRGEMPLITTPIVIGAHQLQDNLLQFDLHSNRLAFTETLLWEEVECSNFKFDL